MNYFVDFLKIPRQLNLFYGLVLEIQKNSQIFYKVKYLFTIKKFCEAFLVVLEQSISHH